MPSRLVWPVLQLGILLGVAFSYSGQAATSKPSTANINSTYTIIPSDYDQNSLEEILASPNGTFQLQFGNLPGQSNPHSLGIVHVASTTLVWYTYRDNNPGQYDNLGGTSTTLQLKEDGDLAITVQGNGVDVLVWSTATSQTGVQAMELREEGNLVLLNSSKGVVWQSFDHPTDTLLATQKLPVGKSLLGSARNGYPSVGRNILAMESHRLVSYVVYAGSEPYWELSTVGNTELAYAAIMNGSISVFDKNGNMIASRGNTTSGAGSSSLQRFWLDTYGNMRVYAYDNTSSQWVTQTQVIEEACALPDDCGFYGLCIPGQACACPPTFNLLVTLNGCVPPRGLVCNSRYGNDFVKIAAASYFAANLTVAATNLSLKACQSLCTSNCSCLGFFYGASAQGAAGACLITNQMRTFSASIYGNYSEKYAYDVYVRVQGKPRSPLAIILGVCIPVAVIIFSLVLWRFVRYKVKVAHAEEEEFLLEVLPGLPPRYSYKELKNATNNFSERIGGGSFGSVYAGVLADGNRIAVKQLEGAVQGKKEFHAEVATIGTVRHLNLVRLRGFCLQKNHRLLVYEHMPRGSLDGLLFKTEGKEKLTWAERLAMAIGVAKGLAYLHEGSPDCIIHCDVKPENILVTDEGVAKLSDFGLAKLMSRQQAYCETNVRGTRGYLAPEWLTGRGQITAKADVYSYGVVLLEMLSGRRNFDGEVESSMSYLPEWVLRNLTSDSANADEILDGAIFDTISDANSLAKLQADPRHALMVALWCLQEEPSSRPAMSRVVRMLEGDVDVPPPPPPANDAAFSLPPSTMAFGTDRLANSEVTMPFLRRASRFLFSSSSATTAPTVASSIF